MNIKKHLWGLYHDCPSCRKVVRDKYVKDNPHIIFKHNFKRRLMGDVLPNDFSKRDWLILMQMFKWRCAYTNSRGNLSVDHFIPLVSGQAGTYIGNLVPMNRSLNSSKKDSHPLEWSRKQGLNNEYINKIISYLSKENGLTTEEYLEFVNWCFANPRTVTEVMSDSRYSIDIWRQETNKQFPLPKYAVERKEGAI